MPAARGVKRTASKASAQESSSGPKNKKRSVFQLEIPTLPKKRGRVLTCGQGDVGQLGLGEDVIETSRFKHVTGLGEKIVYVCAGGMHTVALDSDGKVWTFGCNDEGALGRPTSGETDEGTPKQVSLPLPAVSISAGDSHTAALLNNGDVYAWGSFRDSHGSMGLVMRGREGKPCVSPQHVAISPQQPAAAIASGGDHLVVLTTNGSVYTMGCGEQGQLGRLSQRSATRDTRQGFSPLLQPSKVTIKSTTTKVWAGYHATFALDSNNRLLAWGLNNYGQLGISGDKRKAALFSPVECDAFSSRSSGGGWTQVACGQHHSLALDDDGQVYAIGRCEYGRLGLGDRSGDAESLEPVPKLQNKKCVSIAAGTSNSFAVTESGETYSWGMGSEGQLGTGVSSDAMLPTLATSSALADHTPVVVSAGGQHTVLLAVDPNPARELSPVPEVETAEQTVETNDTEDTEPEEPVEKKPKGRQPKNKKKQDQKQEQVDEVSSTPSVSRRANVQKVNGDEKKGTQMEVDEIDNKEENKTEVDTVAEKNEEIKKESETQKDKVESMDSSSQDTADSDTPSQTSQEQDVDMENNATENVEKKEEVPEKNQEVPEKIGEMEKNELNGSAQDVVESKPLDAVSEISATA